MIDFESLLLSPQGRIGRQTYWTMTTIFVAIAFVLSFIPFFGSLATLPLLWPFGCLVSQRLHDADRRAWPVLLVGILNALTAILSFAVTMMATDPANVVAAFGWALPAMVLSGMATVAALSLFLFAGLARGSDAINRFGPAEHEPVTFAALIARDRA